MIGGLLVALIFFGWLLVKATDITLGVLRKLVVQLKVSPYGLASFLLAFSTSLPELFVGIAAALRGEGDLVLGNILGSNIANLSLVVGGAAALAGVLRAHDQFLKRDVFYVFLAGSFPLLLLVDKQLTRLDGLLLVAVYVLYNLAILERKRKKLAAYEMETMPMWRRVWVKVSAPSTERSLGRLVIGVGLMIGAAEAVVSLARALATSLGISDLVIGLIVISLGTVMPELFFEIEAIKKREVQMAFGNVLGSVVVNSTGILGLVAIISPIWLVNGLQPFWVATLAFTLIFFTFWGLVGSKHRLDRWEGAVLVGLYFIFAAIELFKL